MATEIVYLGHDNSINKTLKEDGAAEALTAVTRITLTLGTTLIDSDNGDADPIRWIKSGYATGEVRFFLGGQTITPGEYENAWVVVYDPTNATGVVWGSFKVEVVAEVEAT